jgi:hypothetical protein
VFAFAFLATYQTSEFAPLSQTSLNLVDGTLLYRQGQSGSTGSTLTMLLLPGELAGYRKDKGRDVVH